MIENSHVEVPTALPQCSIPHWAWWRHSAPNSHVWEVQCREPDTLFQAKSNASAQALAFEPWAPSTVPRLFAAFEIQVPNNCLKEPSEAHNHAVKSQTTWTQTSHVIHFGGPATTPGGEHGFMPPLHNDWRPAETAAPATASSKSKSLPQPYLKDQRTSHKWHDICILKGRISGRPVRVG